MVIVDSEAPENNLKKGVYLLNNPVNIDYVNQHINQENQTMIKFRMRDGSIHNATIISEEDRGAGKGKGIWVKVKLEDGKEVTGRKGQIVE